MVVSIKPRRFLGRRSCVLPIDWILVFFYATYLLAVWQGGLFQQRQALGSPRAEGGEFLCLSLKRLLGPNRC